jgi:hypothetical protein
MLLVGTPSDLHRSSTTSPKYDNINLNADSESPSSDLGEAGKGVQTYPLDQGRDSSIGGGVFCLIRLSLQDQYKRRRQKLFL